MELASVSWFQGLWSPEGDSWKEGLVLPSLGEPPPKPHCVWQLPAGEPDYSLSGNWPVWARNCQFLCFALPSQPTAQRKLSAPWVMRRRATPAGRACTLLCAVSPACLALLPVPALSGQALAAFSRWAWLTDLFGPGWPCLAAASSGSS